MINKYLLEFSYTGSNYAGLQRQSNNSNTIQEIIETRIKKLVKSDSFSTGVASRTDKGVHCKQQFLLIKTAAQLDLERFIFQMNHKLPFDIRVHHCQKVDTHFNLSKAIQYKTYRYYFSTQEQNALYAPFCLSINSKINLIKMKKAAKMLIGEHNFKSLSARTSEHISYNRNIRISLIKECELTSGLYFYEISANGFLKYMIRFIFSALVKVGEGKLSLEEFQLILGQKSEVLIKKAPAHGLCLESIYLKL